MMAAEQEAERAGMGTRNDPEFDFKRTLKRLRRGWATPFSSLNVTVTRFGNTRVTFCTDRTNDPIQDRNRGGRFFEEDALEYLLGHFPIGGTFIDIGANIGNHTLFFALLGNARRVIPIEPNPEAYRILLANIGLNDLTSIVELSHVGIGLSDTDDDGFGMQDRSRNLGGARMIESAGDISVRRGDTILAQEKPDLIKIDVEGMELRVLAGLRETISQHMPRIFIEVDTSNEAAFHEWVVESGYRVEQSFKRWKANTDYLILPNRASG